MEETPKFAAHLKWACPNRKRVCDRKMDVAQHKVPKGPKVVKYAIEVIQNSDVEKNGFMHPDHHSSI